MPLSSGWGEFRNHIVLRRLRGTNNLARRRFSRFRWPGSTKVVVFGQGLDLGNDSGNVWGQMERSPAELRGKRLEDSVLAQVLDPPRAGLLESKT